MFGVVFCFGVSVLCMYLWQYVLLSVLELYVCGDFVGVFGEDVDF